MPGEHGFQDKRFRTRAAAVEVEPILTTDRRRQQLPFESRKLLACHRYSPGVLRWSVQPRVQFFVHSRQRNERTTDKINILF